MARKRPEAKGSFNDLPPKLRAMLAGQERKMFKGGAKCGPAPKPRKITAGDLADGTSRAERVGKLACRMMSRY